MSSDSRFRRALPAAGMAVLLVLHLFLIMPVALYLGNAEELNASLASVLAKYLRPAVFMLALIALLAAMLPAAASRRIGLLLAACVLMIWMQGSLMVWDYGLLDGRAIDWSAQGWRGWLDAALWLALLLFALRAGDRGGKALLILSTVVTLLVLAGSILQVVSASKRLERGPELQSSVSLHQMHRFSAERNVLHIIADGVQTDVFREILADGAEGRRMAEALDGFVLFPQHLGAFPYTHMSVPAILSGRLYDNSEPREAFLESALGRDSPSLLNAAADAGYEIDLAVASGLERLYTHGAFDNLHPLTPGLHAVPADFAARDAATLFDLTLFRVAPHLLKPAIYRDQRWLVQGLVRDSDYLGLASFAHAAFLRDLTARAVADRPQPVYKLMHLMISHEPMATTDDCRFAGSLLPTVRPAVLAQTRCGLIGIIALLERMKALGIYDRASIVLMADHGAWLAPRGHLPAERAEGGPTVLPVAVGLAMPIFAVKAPGVHGPMRESAAPSWIVDTPATIAALAGFSGELPGQDAMQLPPDAVRQRRFLVYRFQRGEWEAEYLAPLQESIVDGSPLDGASWHLQRTLVPAIQRKPAPASRAESQ